MNPHVEAIARIIKRLAAIQVSILGSTFETADDFDALRAELAKERNALLYLDEQLELRQRRREQSEM